jgi:hypothetical protein
MSVEGQRRRSQHVRNESAYPPIAAGEQTSRLVGSVPEADIDPPTSRANLLVGHAYARIVSPHGSLQLGGISLLALCPLDKVGRLSRSAGCSHDQ